MKGFPSHSENIISLKRIEGQIRGIQKMIESRQYCVDILNQIHAVMAALARIEDKILARHFESCVTNAMHGGSSREKKEKLEEILRLIHQFRKL
jgi:DNA-binding FrmR family transcriptional regulator